MSELSHECPQGDEGERGATCDTERGVNGRHAREV
jgi:hypothetical protein